MSTLSKSSVTYRPICAAAPPGLDCGGCGGNAGCDCGCCSTTASSFAGAAAAGRRAPSGAGCDLSPTGLWEVVPRIGVSLRSAPLPVGGIG